MREWREFNSVSTFFVGLFISVLPSLYDLITESLLGWEYFFGSKYLDETEDMASIPKGCDNFANRTTTTLTYNYSCETGGSDIFYQTHEIGSIPEGCLIFENISATALEYVFSCNTEPKRLYGVTTLLIPFLPGIQWYSSLRTKKHKLGKFITSLLFPFFMVAFKVGAEH